MSELANEYAAIIKEFLDGSTPAEMFQHAYFDKFKAETRQMTDLEYEALNGTFSDLDCFDPEGLSVVGPSLNETELRDSVRRRYQSLKSA